MKCQNCGRNEINFHYSSNINGCVTETYLCAECAARSGYNFGQMFSANSVFDSFFPLNMRPAFLSAPAFDFGQEFPYTAWTRPGLPQKECACGGACDAPVRENPTTEVDNEMQKRREINMLKEQMRLAAEREDFEKAAELRDRIKTMEGNYSQ